MGASHAEGEMGGEVERDRRGVCVDCGYFGEFVFLHFGGRESGSLETYRETCSSGFLGEQSIGVSQLFENRG